jgi:hypothetical protein
MFGIVQEFVRGSLFIIYVRNFTGIRQREVYLSFVPLNMMFAAHEGFEMGRAK